MCRNALIFFSPCKAVSKFTNILKTPTKRNLQPYNLFLEAVLKSILFDLHKI